MGAGPGGVDRHHRGDRGWRFRLLQRRPAPILRLVAVGSVRRFFFIPVFFVAFFVFRFSWWGCRGWYFHEDSATVMLRERFARGELTREQFEQMRKDLQR
jgi:Short C-terminal domain